MAALFCLSFFWGSRSRPGQRNCPAVQQRRWGPIRIPRPERSRMTARSKKGFLFLLGISLLLTLSGCVDQPPKEQNSRGTAEAEGEPRIAATSVAVMQICEKLDLDLVGVPHIDPAEIPSRYEKAAEVGSPVSPDPGSSGTATGGRSSSGWSAIRCFPGCTFFLR